MNRSPGAPSLEASRWICLLMLAMIAFAPGSRALGADDAPAPTIALVTAGKPAATLIVPRDDSATAQWAALIADYVRKRTGAVLPVADDPAAAAADQAQVHVGLTEYVASRNPLPADLDPDGVVIAFPEPGRVVIVGGSPKGTEFAVYEFLERYVGVRWLMPGELGEHVPQSPNLSVTAEDVRSEPRFISRTLSSYHTDPGTAPGEWLQRMRVHWRIQFHHNLLNLFPAAKFFDSHPQFYPIVGGERFKPPPTSNGWQPVFDAEGIVDAAVASISGYFDANPEKQSYSLGTNDHHDFGRPGKGTNSVGMPHQSDYYFTFANAVAAGVREKHPGKWFGCLAYGPTTDPPREAGLHPRIVPHICYDRMAWYDPHFREVDQRRTKEWREYAPTLGWYDYVYGDDQYRIPRIYPHLLAETLRFAADQGVKAYYAEAYITPAWTEGPKFYLLTKLLWDPTLDVDRVLDEWYTLAVGESAAPHLADYYALWEAIWKERIPQTEWFKKGAGEIYLRFDKLGYLDVVTEADFERADGLLDRVVEQAGTPQQEARARFIREGYKAVKRDVLDYVRLKRMRVTPQMRETEVLADDFTPGGAAKPDGLPEGWSSWQWDSSLATFGWATDIGHERPGALRVDASGAQGNVTLNRYVSGCTPGDVYRVACRVMFEGLNEGSRPGIVVKWRDEKGEWLSRKTTSEVSLEQTEEGVWHPMELFLRAPKADAALSLVLMLQVEDVKQGIVHFDDVRLTKIERP